MYAPTPDSLASASTCATPLLQLVVVGQRVEHWATPAQMMHTRSVRLLLFLQKYVNHSLAPTINQDVSDG